MIYASPVGELTSRYLKRCGYSAAKIDSWTNETRLLHDLGLCGDDILDELRIMQEEFGVDLSDFNFKEYFPNELSTDAYLLTMRRLLCAIGLEKLVKHVYSKYAEVTLGTIELALKQRKWFSNQNQ